VVTPLGWFYPPDAERERFDAIGRQAGVTLHGTGIHPGGITERFPLVLSALSGSITHVRAAIDDPNISVRPLPVQLEPSSVSDIQSTSFASLHRTIRQTAPQALVAPALLVAATDSRHYQALTKNIFRFLPITLGPDDTKRYHGIDERIAIEDYERCVSFYAQLIRNSQP